MSIPEPIDDLHQIEVALLERRDHLNAQLRAATDDLEPGEADEASSIAQLDVARINLERTRVQLEETEAALARLGEDGFGQCDRCGTSIPIERLLVVPATTRCARCAA